MALNQGVGNNCSQVDDQPPLIPQWLINSPTIAILLTPLYVIVSSRNNASHAKRSA